MCNNFEEIGLKKVSQNSTSRIYFEIETKLNKVCKKKECDKKQEQCQLVYSI